MSTNQKWYLWIRLLQWYIFCRKYDWAFLASTVDLGLKQAEDSNSDEKWEKGTASKGAKMSQVYRWNPDTASDIGHRVHNAVHKRPSAPSSW